MPPVPDPHIDLTFHPAPTATEPRGAVIVCPGGGYQGLAPHEAEPVAHWLNRAGLPAFVLRYRVAPHRHPAAIQDLARAVRLADKTPAIGGDADVAQWPTLCERWLASLGF